MNTEQMYALIKEIIEFRDIRKLVSSEHPEWLTPASLLRPDVDGSELYILDQAAAHMEREIVASLQDIISNDEMEQKHMHLLSDWTRTQEDYLAIISAKMVPYSEAVDIPKNSHKFIIREKDNYNHV